MNNKNVTVTNLRDNADRAESIVKRCIVLPGSETRRNKKGIANIPQTTTVWFFKGIEERR